MRKCNPQVIFLKDIEDRDPVFSVRFYADICTVVFGKPVTQLLQTFCKGKEANLLILCPVVGISDADMGIDSCFVDIKTTAVFLDNFKQ